MIYSHHRNGDFSYITVNETESDDPDYTKVNSSTLDSPNHENFTAYDFESYNLIGDFSFLHVKRSNHKAEVFIFETVSYVN